MDEFGFYTSLDNSYPTEADRTLLVIIVVKIKNLAEVINHKLLRWLSFSLLELLSTQNNHNPQFSTILNTQKLKTLKLYVHEVINIALMLFKGLILLRKRCRVICILLDFLIEAKLQNLFASSYLLPRLSKRSWFTTLTRGNALLLISRGPPKTPVHTYSTFAFMRNPLRNLLLNPSVYTCEHFLSANNYTGLFAASLNHKADNGVTPRQDPVEATVLIMYQLRKT